MGLLKGISKFFGAVFAFIGEYLKEIVLVLVSLFIAAMLTSWYWNGEVEKVTKDNIALAKRISDSNEKIEKLKKDSKDAADTAETEAASLKEKLKKVQSDYATLKGQDKDKSKIVIVRVPDSVDLSGIKGQAGPGSGSGTKKRPSKTEDGGKGSSTDHTVKGMKDVPVYLTPDNEVQCERFFPSFPNTINDYVKEANGPKKEKK